MVLKCRICGKHIEASLGAKVAECIECDVLYRDISKLEIIFADVDDKNGEDIPNNAFPLSATKGEIIDFGRYDQDDGIQPISWLVLDVRDGKALLLSQKALEARHYHNRSGSVTWEKCDLRKWLNGDFYNQAFREAEKERILETHVIAHRHPSFPTVNSGNDTYDRVFCLSLSEVKKYFSANSKRRCQATEHAENRGAWIDKQRNCYWWLRTPGSSLAVAAGIKENGEESYDTVKHSSGQCLRAVRPAIWIRT